MYIYVTKKSFFQIDFPIMELYLSDITFIRLKWNQKKENSDGAR